MIDISLYHSFLSKEEADELYTALIDSSHWQKELLKDDGTKSIITRKMAYVDNKASDYHYTNLTVKGNTWNDFDPVLEATLRSINHFCCSFTHENFNSVLLNLYEDGKDEIRWHSDKEEQLGDEPKIVTLNLGVTRLFQFKNKENTSEILQYPVAHGDLLIMHERCQKKYLHAILKEKDINEPRISLTFRKTIFENIHEGIQKEYADLGL